MRIAHLTWLVSRNGGGIPGAIFALAKAQRAMGHEVNVAAVADPAAAPEGDARTFVARGPIALGFAPHMGAFIETLAPDLLHLHGLFTWPSQVARRFGRRTARPVVVSPHGMLEPWALANSAWKKRLFRALIEDDNLRHASCLHALCVPEAAQFRKLGLRNAVAVVPNGVVLPDRNAAAVAFHEHYPKTRGRRIVLFLGRIHPKKGLPHLVDAWASVRANGRLNHEWMLVIAGPDQLGHRAEVAQRVSELGLEEDVLFTGPLHGSVKQSALAAAGAFVLPSFSEGFSVAVLEAMAWQLPVLITRQCNFDVEAFGGGIVGDPNEVSIAQMLSAFLGLNDQERRAMGERARREVELRYTWERVARDLLETYGFVLGSNAKPGFIESEA